MKKEKTKKEHHGGLANEKRNISTLVHWRAGRREDKRWGESGGVGCIMLNSGRAREKKGEVSSETPALS